MQLTTHFNLQEFLVSATGSRLGLDNTPPADVLENIQRMANYMEELRLYFRRPIHIISGYRSPAVNTAVGGSKTSAHRLGLAADFTIQGMANLEVCRTIAKDFSGWDQIIYEFGPTGWIHMGLSRGEPRHQRLTAVRKEGQTIYLNGFMDT